MNATAVRTVSVTKRYGGLTAVREVELELGSGECLALLGSNGAGKSTLLRLLASLTRPTSGEVWLFGRPFRRGLSSPAARRAVGYAGHALLTYRSLSPRQNLDFFARLYGLRSPRERADLLLHRFGLGGRLDDPSGALSRGLQQRLALARAFLHDPDLLLLDEPFSSLDAGGCRLVHDAIRESSSRGCAVIIATHDLDRAAALAGRVAILNEGRLAHHGAAPAGAAAWADLYRRWSGEEAA
jgi:heme exporter protein A